MTAALRRDRASVFGDRWSPPLLKVEPAGARAPTGARLHGTRVSFDDLLRNAAAERLVERSLALGLAKRVYQARWRDALTNHPSRRHAFRWRGSNLLIDDSAMDALDALEARCDRLIELANDGVDAL